MLFHDMDARLFSSLPAGDHAEVRSQCNRHRAVALLNGDLVANARSETAGISARVYRHGVYGMASQAECTADSATTVLRAATENARFMDSRVGKGKPSLSVLPSRSFTVDAPPTDATQKQLIDFAREVDAHIASACPQIASRTVQVRNNSMEKYLCINDGGQGWSQQERCHVYIFLSALSPDGAPVELFVPLGGYGGFHDLFSDPAQLYGDIDRLYDTLMKKREGVHAEAGLHDVVMGPDLAGILAHEAVGHTVEADLVLGGSVAGHCLGQTVASPLVTMVDFAHTALGKPAPLPLFVDDEGVTCEDVTIIDHGVLVGYMNNRETAQHFGMKPCGNARAYRFSDEPLIRMRNTAILPGHSRLEEMIAAVDDGYYLVSTNNGQADTTGEFMFGVSMGYEIKHGRLGRAILDTTISGVAFDMLKTVDMLSDDMVWSCAGTCGKKQPMPVGMGGPAIKCKVTMGGR